MQSHRAQTTSHHSITTHLPSRRFYVVQQQVLADASFDARGGMFAGAAGLAASAFTSGGLQQPGFEGLANGAQGFDAAFARQRGLANKFAVQAVKPPDLADYVPVGLLELLWPFGQRFRVLICIGNPLAVTSCLPLLPLSGYRPYQCLASASAFASASNPCLQSTWLQYPTLRILLEVLVMIAMCCRSRWPNTRR